MRQGKIRVMIVPKELMDRADAFAGDLRFESSTHSERVKTLKKMQEDYQRGEAKMQYCLNVRINIAC